MFEQMNGSMQSSLHAGLKGYQQGQSDFSNASRDLAHGLQNGKRATDINRAAIDLTSASNQAQASAEVISRADGMLGTIIDTFA